MLIDYDLVFAYRSLRDVRDVALSLASTVLYTNTPLSGTAVVLSMTYDPDAEVKDRFRLICPPTIMLGQELASLYGPTFPIRALTEEGKLGSFRSANSIRVPYVAQLVHHKLLNEPPHIRKNCSSIVVSAIHQELGPCLDWQKAHGKQEPAGWEDVITVRHSDIKLRTALSHEVSESKSITKDCLETKRMRNVIELVASNAMQSDDGFHVSCWHSVGQRSRWIEVFRDS